MTVRNQLSKVRGQKSQVRTQSPSTALFPHQGIIGLRFLNADQAVAVGVDLAEELLAPKPFLARDIPVAVTIHLAEPERAAARAIGGALAGGGVQLKKGVKIVAG